MATGEGRKATDRRRDKSHKKRVEVNLPDTDGAGPPPPVFNDRRGSNSHLGRGKRAK